MTVCDMKVLDSLAFSNMLEGILTWFLFYTRYKISFLVAVTMGLWFNFDKKPLHAK